ncbi:hypothetical protein LTR36_001583 [Oleoguttula mirabilis]|uniref:Uncharacterized protein n=1 Tax=Oleoguttula mirabilis TaxID=1507867 RepID=A0AAV9JN83_9PEZI|nr:hypothetical protein LTR36_001583 [Oleoguttula mirabilis]
MGSRSLLLDLPPELRNSVYEYLAYSVKSVDVRRGRVAQAPLARASRQLMTEYGTVFEREGAANAAVIYADVFDFDFRALVTFLNKLPAPAIHTRERQRELVVDIVLTAPGSGDAALLTRWALRCERLDEQDDPKRHVLRTYNINIEGSQHDSKSLRAIDERLRPDIFERRMQKERFLLMDDGYDILSMVRQEVWHQQDMEEERRRIFASKRKGFEAAEGGALTGATGTKNRR